MVPLLAIAVAAAAAAAIAAAAAAAAVIAVWLFCVQVLDCGATSAVVLAFGCNHACMTNIYRYVVGHLDLTNVRRLFRSHYMAATYGEGWCALTAEAWTARYEKYCGEVEAYFSDHSGDGGSHCDEERLLVINVIANDGMHTWEQLCHFLASPLQVSPQLQTSKRIATVHTTTTMAATAGDKLPPPPPPPTPPIFGRVRKVWTEGSGGRKGDFCFPKIDAFALTLGAQAVRQLWVLAANTARATLRPTVLVAVAVVLFLWPVTYCDVL
jgi:hypothetical protein